MISNICKHNPSKHNELRYQIKKHEIVEKFKRNNLQPYSPKYLFIYLFFVKNEDIMLSEEKTKEHKEV